MFWTVVNVTSETCGGSKRFSVVKSCLQLDKIPWKTRLVVLPQLCAGYVVNHHHSMHQRFLNGEHACKGGVNKFPRGREPLRALQHGIFMTEGDLSNLFI